MGHGIKRASKIVTGRLFQLVAGLAVIAGVVLYTVMPAAATTYNIFGNQTPTTLSDADTASVELGTKFQSSVNGTVTGVRFYKSTANTGTHSGTLWSRSGSKLATVNFTSETASGWQSATFSAPVQITAKTTYIISYHASKGHYSSTTNFFASTAATNGPLTALKNGTDGNNGVYVYSSAITFPTSSYNATNYFVDPMFNDGQTGTADTTPPTVSTVAPPAASTGNAIDTAITASFNEALTASTVNTTSFSLKDAAGTAVPAAVSYNAATYTASLQPTAPLANNVTYTATLTTAIKDAAGNALAASKTWSFSTAPVKASSPLANGPGGPILVLLSSGKPFSAYYAEILRAEGLNSFSSADVANLTASQLSTYSTVIVGDISLTAAQVSLLTNWTTAGGNLIAMHPDKQLAGLLGLTDQNSSTAEGYIKTDTSQAPGAGITDQTIQYHGSADKYGLASGTRAVASLYTDATTATSFPAVTVRSVGTSGGHAAAFSFDLAKSIVYTHQGNPAWAGQERDGSAPIRPNDLFYGAKAGDVQPDYVNLDKVAIPQADEQQRLLANLIEYVNADQTPLPKFWYFPNDNKAVIVMAGDDHATASGTQDSFNNMLSLSPANCSVAAWTCYRATSWVYTNSPLTNSQAVTYRGQGFDVGDHVSTGCNDYTSQTNLDDTFASELSGFRAKYTGLPNQTGSRTHCIAWSDWASTPKVESKYGIRVDLNYYYWPGSWVQNRPGFFTGSGTPMRYADLDGSMIDVFQVPSHLVNESGQTFPANIDTQLDRALGPLGYYGAIGTHYDYSDSFDRQLVQSAINHKVPLVSAQQILDWTDGRNASSFGTPNWSGNNLTFTISADAKTNGMLRAMLPISSSKGKIASITQGANPVSYTTDTRKGIQYAVFPAASGSYSVAYAADTTPPAVTATTPQNGATNISLSPSLKAVFSEPLDPASVTSASVELKQSNNTVIASTASLDSSGNTLTVTPKTALATNTAYSLVLHGGAADPRLKDTAGNPLAADTTVGFTTVASQNYSLWQPATPPFSVATTDTAKVELGTQFKVANAGKITAIVFYKGTADAAQHSVTLWDNAGNALATTTSTTETAAGWQTVNLTTPVNISPGIQYTASYTAPVGQYAYTSSNLNSAFDTGVLSVPANGGVYKYGGGFPTTSFGGSNYWVDVIYTP